MQISARLSGIPIHLREIDSMDNLKGSSINNVTIFICIVAKKKLVTKNSDVICGRSLFYAICGLPLNMTYNTVISQVALHHLSISIPDISTQKACLMDGVFRLRLLKNLSNWVWERRGNKEPDEKGTVENQKRCQPKRLFFYS